MGLGWNGGCGERHEGLRPGPGGTVPSHPWGDGGERECWASERSSSQAALGGRQNDCLARGGKTARLRIPFLSIQVRRGGTVGAFWTQDFASCCVHLGRGRSLLPGLTLQRARRRERVSPLLPSPHSSSSSKSTDLGDSLWVWVGVLCHSLWDLLCPTQTPVVDAHKNL